MAAVRKLITTSVKGRVSAKPSLGYAKPCWVGVRAASSAGRGGGSDKEGGSIQVQGQERAPAGRGLSQIPSLLGDLWDPRLSPRSLTQMLDAVDRLLDDDLFRDAGGIGRGVRAPWDVVEDDQAFHLRFDLPGFGKDEVKVHVQDRVLVIQADKSQISGKDARFKSRARESYLTRLDLPQHVKLEDIWAEMKDGVLNVSVPKSPTHQPNVKQIPVN